MNTRNSRKKMILDDCPKFASKRCKLVNVEPEDVNFRQNKKFQSSQLEASVQDECSQDKEYQKIVGELDRKNKQEMLDWKETKVENKNIEDRKKIEKQNRQVDRQRKRWIQQRELKDEIIEQAQRIKDIQTRIDSFFNKRAVDQTQFQPFEVSQLKISKVSFEKNFSETLKRQTASVKSTINSIKPINATNTVNSSILSNKLKNSNKIKDPSQSKIKDPSQNQIMDPSQISRQASHPIEAVQQKRINLRDSRGNRMKCKVQGTKFQKRAPGNDVWVENEYNPQSTQKNHPVKKNDMNLQKQSQAIIIRDRTRERAKNKSDQIELKH